MVLIRTAAVQDAPGIATVHVRSWQTTYPGIMPDAVLQALSIKRRTTFWDQGLRNPHADGFTLVAEEGGQIVGFASAGLEREEDPVYRCELQALYLLKEHQGRGGGRMLFCETVRRLRTMGFTKMLLWVAKENGPARAFYEKMGGSLLREKTVMMHGAPLLEAAYGYDLAQTGCSQSHPLK